jgi:hypothetical protein
VQQMFRMLLLRCNDEHGVPNLHTNDGGWEDHASCSFFYDDVVFQIFNIEIHFSIRFETSIFLSTLFYRHIVSFVFSSATGLDNLDCDSCFGNENPRNILIWDELATACPFSGCVT